MVARVPLPVRDRLFRLLYPQGVRVAVNGEVLRLDAAFRRYADYEPEVGRLLLDEIRDGDVVVDVGANIGVHVVPAARRVGSGMVFAIEPDPAAAAMLERHVRLNRQGERVRVLRLAAAAESSVIPFSAHERTAWSTGSDLRARPGTRFLAVPALRLDALFERIDILKVDVEGMEGAVLRGASGVLSADERRPRLILVEVHEQLLAARDESWAAIRDSVPGYRWESIPGTAPEEWVGRRDDEGPRDRA